MLTVGEFLSCLASNPVYILIIMIYAPAGYMSERYLKAMRDWFFMTLVFSVQLWLIPLVVAYLVSILTTLDFEVTLASLQFGYLVGMIAAFIRDFIVRKRRSPHSVY